MRFKNCILILILITLFLCSCEAKNELKSSFYFEISDLKEEDGEYSFSYTAAAALLDEKDRIIDISYDKIDVKVLVKDGITEYVSGTPYSKLSKKAELSKEEEKRFKKALKEKSNYLGAEKGDSIGLGIYADFFNEEGSLTVYFYSNAFSKKADILSSVILGKEKCIISFNNNSLKHFSENKNELIYFADYLKEKGINDAKSVEIDYTTGKVKDSVVLRNCNISVLEYIYLLR